MQQASAGHLAAPGGWPLNDILPRPGRKLIHGETSVLVPKEERTFNHVVGGGAV